MRNLMIALIAAGLMMSGPIAAQAVYKVTGPDGKVRYTDEKPENAGTAKVETVTLPTEQNILKADPAMQSWLQQKQNAEQEAANNQAQSLSGWQAEYDAAEAALEAAEAALEKGKEPQEGDYIGIANRFGGSAGARPSEEYLERLDELQQAVDDAREHLEAVAASKPAISQ
ncbi:MAG TPA: DUF4124 domain-containing protein [Pseudomonadales bacterium]|jgi:hypothetical protein